MQNRTFSNRSLIVEKLRGTKRNVYARTKGGDSSLLFLRCMAAYLKHSSNNHFLLLNSFSLNHVPCRFLPHFPGMFLIGRISPPPSLFAFRPTVINYSGFHPSDSKKGGIMLSESWCLLRDKDKWAPFCGVCKAAGVMRRIYFYIVFEVQVIKERVWLRGGPHSSLALNFNSFLLIGLQCFSF